MCGALYQPFPMGSAAGAQIWRYSPAFRRPRHFHSEPELNFVAAGTAQFGVGEGHVTARAGDLVWWLPGQDHELTKATADLDMFVVGLTPHLSERVLGLASGAAHGRSLLTHLPPDVAPRMFERCASLLVIRDVPAIEQHVGDLWRDAHACRFQGDVMHPLTRRAVRLLMDGGDVRRDDVSAELADPGDVSRHFHRDVQLTFATYRSRLRLLRFIVEVDGQRGNLLEAALASGFGSYSQCHRSFVSTFGCTPRAFFAGPTRSAMSAAYAPFQTP
jgi:AraC-like DNA-binding protein